MIHDPILSGRDLLFVLAWVFCGMSANELYRTVSLRRAGYEPAQSPVEIMLVFFTGPFTFLVILLAFLISTEVDSSLRQWFGSLYGKDGQ